MTLGKKERKRLRALGHRLRAVLWIGREGLSEPVLASAAEALAAHELIKVKLGRNCPLDKDEAAGLLARRCQAHLVQRTGRTILLYRPNPDLPPDRRISLEHARPPS